MFLGSWGAAQAMSIRKGDFEGRPLGTAGSAVAEELRRRMDLTLLGVVSYLDLLDTGLIEGRRSCLKRRDSGTKINHYYYERTMSKYCIK